jgi:hypothetical protein
VRWFYNGFSGSTFVEDYCISGYNTFFTNFPGITKAIFDYDVNPDIDGEDVKPYM